MEKMKTNGPVKKKKKKNNGPDLLGPKIWHKCRTPHVFPVMDTFCTMIGTFEKRLEKVGWLSRVRKCATFRIVCASS